MYSSLLIPSLFFSLALAAPVHEARAAAPSVTIKNGTVVGSTTGTVDSFKGIPFAEPPLSSLRLKPPQTYSTTYPGGTIIATGTPTACPQFLSQVNTTDIPSDVLGDLLDSPLVQAVTVEGEDCLTLNVQRPAGTTSSSKLPVIFWIFGGGFEFGSTQTYDGSTFVQKSIALDEPVLYVAVNYRVGGFGFLAGQEVTNDGSTNLGLRDQRLGLQWVQDNIAAFGGDPTKVTIWGESAGAISVFDHTIINSGDINYNGSPLFRGAIMDSGSIVSTENTSSAAPQAIYDTVVENAGCSGSSDSLECLRSVSYATLRAAVNSVPAIFGERSLDLSYLPRPDPSSAFFPVSPDVAVTNGDYAKVPIIIGDQEDEGTLFSLSQVDVLNTADLVAYLETFFQAGADLVAGLVATYPDTASSGSPFNTGALNEIRPEFKRLAAILGDFTFTLVRREYLSRVASTLPGAWSYLDSHLYGLAVLGTFHASDTLEAFDDTPDLITADAYMTYYISFVNYLNPNTISTASPLIEWPEWSASQQLINFQPLVNVLITDDFRETEYNYLNEHFGQFSI